MKKSIFMLFILIISLAVGCSNNKDNTNTIPKDDKKGNVVVPKEEANKAPKIGNIYLGEPLQEVKSKLSGDYTEEVFPADTGYFGEAFIIRKYDKRLDLTIGNNTKKVLQFTVYSPEFETELGVKVGDPASKALAAYREKYQEWVGNQSPEKLLGWFEIEPGVILILRFDNETNSNFNAEINPDAKLLSITLGYTKFFD